MATRTWTGTTSGDISLDANWGGTKPTGTDDGIIPAGTTNPSSGSLTLNNLTNNASSTIAGGTWTLNGNLVNNGGIYGGSPTFYIAGTFTNNYYTYCGQFYSAGGGESLAVTTTSGNALFSNCTIHGDIVLPVGGNYQISFVSEYGVFVCTGKISLDGPTGNYFYRRSADASAANIRLGKVIDGISGALQTNFDF